MARLILSMVRGHSGSTAERMDAACCWTPLAGARKETYAFALEEEFHAAGVFVVYVMESIIASNDATADVKGVHQISSEV